MDGWYRCPSRPPSLSCGCVQARGAPANIHACAIGLMEARGTTRFAHGSTCTDWKPWKRIECTELFPDGGTSFVRVVRRVVGESSLDGRRSTPERGFLIGCGDSEGGLWTLTGWGEGYVWTIKIRGSLKVASGESRAEAGHLISPLTSPEDLITRRYYVSPGANRGRSYPLASEWRVPP